jgi:DNA-binding response OmpR family regulator
MSEDLLRKIILVEDDESMKSVLGTLLEIEGYKVVLAPDRRPLDEIVQSIRDHRPEVVLIDVHLKQVSGFDILRAMREDPELAGVRVILSSGMDLREQCLAAGADEFLLKPYMPDELLVKLKQ